MRATDSRHILNTNFISTLFNQFISQICVILYGMNRRMCNTQTALGNHTSRLCILNRRFYIPNIIQTTERTSDIGSLSFLNLIK